MFAQEATILQPKVAIHAHVFYPDLWPQIFACISNFLTVCGNSNVCVVVTFPQNFPELKAVIEKSNTANKPIKVIAVENRGYDVGPFIDFLNNLDLKKFDYIVKLHTKRNINFWLNFHYFQGSEWRDCLLSFCSSEKNVKQSLKALSNNSRIGMIASRKLINYACTDLPEDIKKHKAGLAKIGLSMRYPVTVVGTMFMVRANLLLPFQNRYQPTDFVTSGKAHQDYGLAGILEYLIPMSISAQGYVISEGVFPWRLALIGHLFRATIFRFIRLTSNIVTLIVGSNNIAKIHRFLEK